jgi:hypothetical protein
MKVKDLENPPQWLLDAWVDNEDVEIIDGVVVWRSGTWCDGTWHGGTWCDGTWNGGTWLGGIWRSGDWNDITLDRLLYMAALLGIVFKDGKAIAYRTTGPGGLGRHNNKFMQPTGEYYEDDLPPPGSGTCVAGIHVTSPVIAYYYFEPTKDAQLWRVTFDKEDLLDCDGQKARIRGGVFEKIEWPF